MNRTEFLEFVSKNFNIGGDAMRLIDNILQYAQKLHCNGGTGYDRS